MYKYCIKLEALGALTTRSEDNRRLDGSGWPPAHHAHRRCLHSLTVHLERNVYGIGLAGGRHSSSRSSGAFVFAVVLQHYFKKKQQQKSCFLQSHSADHRRFLPQQQRQVQDTTTHCKRLDNLSRSVPKVSDKQRLDEKVRRRLQASKECWRTH